MSWPSLCQGCFSHSTPLLQPQAHKTERLGNQTIRILNPPTSSSSRAVAAARFRHLDELIHDYLTIFHNVKMYMMSLKAQITPIAVAVVDGIQGTLGRLNSYVLHSLCVSSWYLPIK